jgi:PPOX class probable F420-dependent enzyme
VTAAGTAHVVPLCFALVADVIYSGVDHKPKRSPRLRRIANVVATGSASVLVDHFEEDWSALWWVRVDGTGRLVEDRAEADVAIAALQNKYPQYEQHPPGYPLVAIDIQRWTSWSAS